MATPNQEAIDTFMSITDAVAVQKLEEHRGDLNQAVNAYFSEGDPNIVREAPLNVPHDDAMDIDDVIPAARRESPLSLLTAARTMGLDSNFGRSIFDNDPLPPFVSHPREVRQIPIEVKDSSGPSGRSSDAPIIEDVTKTAHVQGPATQGTVIIDKESDDDIPFAPTRRSRQTRPAGSAANNNQDYNDIEEEMIRAAIEASKVEAERSNNPLPEERPSHMEDDDDIAKAVTMSLKSAEEEVQGYKASTSEIGTSEMTAAQGPQDTEALNGRLAAPSSPFEDAFDEQPLVRHRSRRAAFGSLAPRPPPDADRSQSQSPEEGDHASNNPAGSGNGFPSEWGGISSEEHDEAVMLEETGYNHLPFVPRAQPRPPSPSLTAQRLIREQQEASMETTIKNPTNDGEWTVVLPSKRKQSRTRRKPKISIQQDDLEIDPMRQAKLRQKMEISILKIKNSNFYTRFIEQLKSPEVTNHFNLVLDSETELQIVIYGIGSIESYESPRFQLNLAILLKKEFDWFGGIEVFDPILSATESIVLESYGCRVLSVNEEARREALKPTLFFMPHCETNLYKNLLETNWRTDRLSKIVLFGNSFKMYEEQVSFDSEVIRAVKRIAAARRIADEFAVETVSDDFFAAFHDLSLHFFCSGLDSELPLLI